jgi:hypothetical protein
MCTKILLSQMEQLRWDGVSRLVGNEWSLQFFTDSWTKGLAVTLYLTGFKREKRKCLVLRQGQRVKLIREMVCLWAGRESVESTAWIGKRIDKDTRIGPNLQQFVNAIMSRWVDGNQVACDRAMGQLRRAVAKAQKAGLTEADMKAAWDEALLAQMLLS